MTFMFAGLIVLSLVLAVVSRRGHAVGRAEDFFVAGGQFGVVLFFFLAVGETYSVGTVLGFPGGMVAHGTGFVSWFLGYILLSFPVGYFLYPLIWRAGRLHGAVTLPDMFRGHFRSRGLEVLLTVASILFLVPLGVMQCIGLNTVLHDLGWPVPPLLLAGVGGGLAFTYIAISGIRAPAYVAVLKDVLVMAAILMTGLACLAAPQAAALPPSAPMPAAPAPVSDVFAISTILLQALGFCVVPQTCATVFTARSPRTIRRAQAAMPLYMVMFPFLTVIAGFALHHDLHLASPNDAFLAVSRALLPGWAAGVVMAGAALSALVVLTGICLALGPLVTRNLVPGLNSRAQASWAKLVMAAYLLLSIAGAARSTALMVAINNLFYFGVTQSFPGVIAIVTATRIRPGFVAAGLIAGDAVGVGLHEAGFGLGGMNPGLIGLAVNAVIVFAGRKEGLLF
jgi:SSS family solute:Na+ symporter